MKDTPNTVFENFSLTKVEQTAIKSNIENYIKSHISDGGAQQNNMAARREDCTSTDIENPISEQVSIQS